MLLETPCKNAEEGAMAKRSASMRPLRENAGMRRVTWAILLARAVRPEVTAK